MFVEWFTPDVTDRSLSADSFTVFSLSSSFARAPWISHNTRLAFSSSWRSTMNYFLFCFSRTKGIFYIWILVVLLLLPFRRVFFSFFFFRLYSSTRHPPDIIFLSCFLRLLFPNKYYNFRAAANLHLCENDNDESKKNEDRNRLRVCRKVQINAAISESAYACVSVCVWR